MNDPRNRAADQRSCFCYLDSTIPLLPKSQFQSYMSDLVGNFKDRFANDATQLSC